MYYSYLTKLIEEYKRVRNIEKFNYFDANQNAMFRGWLNDLKLSSFRYRSFLENLKIMDNFDDVVEFGKGEEDTVTLQKDNAILVTPYANSFENVGNRILIKNKSVDVFDKVEVTLEKSKGKLTIYPPTYFLIQNPTEKEENLTYNLIRHGNPVCFGIYGSHYDYDYSKKLETFQTLVNTSYQPLEIEEYKDLETKGVAAYTKKRR